MVESETSLDDKSLSVQTQRGNPLIRTTLLSFNILPSLPNMCSYVLTRNGFSGVAPSLSSHLLSHLRTQRISFFSSYIVST